MGPPVAGTGRVCFDEFELDLSSGELWRHGTPVDLPPQSARVLVILVERAGRLVRHGELRERIWGDAWIEWETGLHQAIRRIRKALGETGARPRYIDTMPRRGYRFRAPVELVEASTFGGGELGRGARAPSQGHRGRLAAVALLVALAGGAAWMATPGPRGLPRTSGATSVEVSGSGDEEANRLYREGTYLLGRGRLAAAEARFHRAAERAPEWAAPWNGIAQIELARDGDDRIARARQALERALARDPDGGETWRQLARLRLWEAWDWVGARGALERAITADPMSPEVWQLFAALETVLGREEAALAAARQALRLDPVSTARRVDLGWTLYYFGHPEEALTECRRSLELEEDNPSARQCVLQSLVVAERWDEVGGLFASASDPDEALTIYLERQITAVGEGASCTTAAATTIPRLLLGRVSGALDALLLGARAGHGWEVPFARIDPLLAPWRSDPRFAEVVARLKLPVAPSLRPPG